MWMEESNVALLMMDLQNGIVSRYVTDEHWQHMIPFHKAVEGARSAGIPIIFVRVGFRDGYPEVSPQNKMFSAIESQGGGMLASDDSTEISTFLKRCPNEPIVTKRRVSAFSGSDLEMILRANKIDTLVLSGISTSGVVLSTLREAADKDYELIVLSDACLDGDPEVHRVLMEKVFPRQAEVSTVDEWLETLDME
ncbi:MAG TPA: cysteine hydrolase [Bacillota bacterium]|nr:cysteine hydrolase [Bacillota bacterium]